MNPTEQMRRMITGYRVSQAIHVAATLGLSDLLSAEPQTVGDLATATECDQRTLHRLLRALASLEIYRELPDGRYASTPLGDQLRSDNNANCRALAARWPSWQAWSGLLHSVERARMRLVSARQTVWEYNTASRRRALFDANMTSMSRQAAGPSWTYDSGPFTPGRRGWRRGAPCPRSETSALRGILFDQPQVVANAAASLKEMGVEDRCETIGGDMFEVATARRRCVHDEGDPARLGVTRRPWPSWATGGRAMAGSGTLLIIEQLLDDAARWSPSEI
jgi:hypothetical protein